ncbi:MAG TPA: cupredoxin domain-containing protein [Rhizomicrobium sp.]|jgi:uncharacterized cupredoxin-like copper-binding protein
MVMRRLSVGLLIFSTALLFGAGSAMGETSAQTLAVDMSNYSFTPNTLQLHANTAYRLELRNTSHSGHSFSARQLFAIANVATGDRAKIENGEVEVDGGQTVDVIFAIPTPGIYKFHCTHFLHSAFGMTGEAVVK